MYDYTRYVICHSLLAPVRLVEHVATRDHLTQCLCELARELDLEMEAEETGSRERDDHGNIIEQWVWGSECSLEQWQHLFELWAKVRQYFQASPGLKGIDRWLEVSVKAPMLALLQHRLETLERESEQEQSEWNSWREWWQEWQEQRKVDPTSIMPES